MIHTPLTLSPRRHASLCQLAGRWAGGVPEHGIIAEEKRDGWRALWFQPALWTRNGFQIEGVAHITHWLRLMERVAGQPMFFDGELVVDGTLAATKAWCETGWKRGGNAGTLYLFDCMTLADWTNGGGADPWHVRKAKLQSLWKAAQEHPLSWEWPEGLHGDAPLSVKILADQWLFDASDVQAEAQRVWAAGGEGLVLKDPEATYQRARSNAWMKVKK